MSASRQSVCKAPDLSIGIGIMATQGLPADWDVTLYGVAGATKSEGSRHGLSVAENPTSVVESLNRIINAVYNQQNTLYAFVTGRISCKRFITTCLILERPQCFPVSSWGGHWKSLIPLLSNRPEKDPVCWTFA